MEHSPTAGHFEWIHVESLLSEALSRSRVTTV